MFKVSCQICCGKVSAFHSWHVLSCCVVLSYVDLHWIVLTCIKLLVFSFSYTLYHNMWTRRTDGDAGAIAGVWRWKFCTDRIQCLAKSLTTNSILWPQTASFSWSQTSALRFPTSDCRFRPWTSALRGQSAFCAHRMFTFQLRARMHVENPAANFLPSHK